MLDNRIRIYALESWTIEKKRRDAARASFSVKQRRSNPTNGHFLNHKD